MRKTPTGKTILENTMEIIQRMAPSSIEAFAKNELIDRKQPAYLKLFQHLKRKIDDGTVAESVNEPAIKKWVESKGNVYDDLIANLYKKLLAHLGTEFAQSEEEVWYKSVNRQLDAAEALLKLELTHQAKPILDDLDDLFRANTTIGYNRWEYAVARFTLVRMRWAYLFSNKEPLAWMKEISDFVHHARYTYAERLRKHGNEPSIQDLNAQWSGLALIRRLRLELAERSRDYTAKMAAWKQYLESPPIATFRELKKREVATRSTGPNSKQWYADPIIYIEQFFLRLIALEEACQHGDQSAAETLLHEPFDVPPARILYPACNMWAVYKLYERKMAQAFTHAVPTEPVPLGTFLEHWALQADEAIKGMPLRMEIHQILIHYGSGQIETALQRTETLINKSRKHRANPDLRLIELLAHYEAENRDHWNYVGPLKTMANKQKAPEWQFVKAFLKFMENAPYLDLNSAGITQQMEQLTPQVQHIIATADPKNPTHQLILWRIRRWQSGEGHTWDGKRSSRGI